MHKELGGDTVGTAEPNFIYTYIEYPQVIWHHTQCIELEEVGRMFKVIVFVFPEWEWRMGEHLPSSGK